VAVIVAAEAAFTHFCLVAIAQSTLVIWFPHEDLLLTPSHCRHGFLPRVLDSKSDWAGLAQSAARQFETQYCVSYKRCRHGVQVRGMQCQTAWVKRGVNIPTVNRCGNRSSAVQDTKVSTSKSSSRSQDASWQKTVECKRALADKERWLVEYRY
jgi:hypothetical protein